MITPSLWPHQQRGIEQASSLMNRGVKNILITSPTGGGKSRMMHELAGETHLGVSVFSVRRMLTEQLYNGFSGAGIPVGVRASGYKEWQDAKAKVQITSMQTEASRWESASWHLPAAHIVEVDEAHLQKAETACKVFEHYADEGAIRIGFTATPLGVSHLYDELIVAGTNSELRQTGAHLPCLVYAPSEIDTASVEKVVTGEDFTSGQIKKMWSQAIYGNVIEHYLTLNPEQKPALLMAPGTAEAVYFAKAFEESGIAAASVDGSEIWFRGERMKANRNNREMVNNALRAGEIKVICNRFVYREAVDIPELYHLILACPIGSILSYIQTVGRVLRNHESLDHVIVQDHGGCLCESTEVLTPNGWVGVDGISSESQVAGFDLSTGEISWQPILHTHDRIAAPEEQMFEASGKMIDIRVTGNHRIAHKHRTCDANNQAFWPKEYKFSRADEVALSKVRFRVPVSGKQRGFDGVPLRDCEIEFLGWFITDGTCAGKREALSISQANHQPQISDLRKTLDECGFDYIERPFHSSDFNSRPATRFHIPKGTGYGSKKRNGWYYLRPYIDKDMSPLLEEMTNRQFRVFLHAVHLGDGDKAKGKNGSYRISTGNKKFADRLQSMCVRRGMACNISTQTSDRKNDLYVLNIRDASFATIHGAQPVGGQTSLSYVANGPERVWCVANPLETLVIRRNGKVCIVGNSWWRHGSPNEDRPWEDYWQEHPTLMTKERAERFQQAKERDDIEAPEPICCPKCQAIRSGGITCHSCGHQADRSVRPVIQRDGKLTEKTGDVFKKRRRAKDKPEMVKKWVQCVMRCKNSGRTFAQARGLFAYENYGQHPRPEWEYYPKKERDLFRFVSDVPREALN